MQTKNTFLRWTSRPVDEDPFGFNHVRNKWGEDVEGKPMGAVSAFTGRDYQPQPIQKERRKRGGKEETKSGHNIKYI